MSFRFLTFLILFPFAALAQFQDDFSDGNFTGNPVWLGDTAKYIVNGQFQLQLSNSVGTDIAYLSSAVATSDSTVWEFYLKMAFSPSANNNVRIYLKSDMSDLKSPLNGYYIGIGETGNLDGIDLFRQSGTSETKIINGIDGHGAVNPEVRIRVIRMQNGQWSVYSDTSGGTSFILEGTVNDATHNLGNYIGVVCKHTSANVNKFYFDDFFVSPVFIDLTPPKIQSVAIITNTELDLLFNEPVDTNTAQSPLNYSISNGIGSPVAAIRNTANHLLVQLQLIAPLQSGQNYWLHAYNISDLSGNLLVHDSISFIYADAQPGDVIINEIMADPTPIVGLPDKEYVELYNKTFYPIDLAGWVFSDASTTIQIPAVIIPADSFLIICNVADMALFSSFGNVVGVPSLPALNNTGDDLSIRNASGIQMDKVSYSDTWYRNSNKKDGGWSLELIDPNTNCKGSSNWIASVDNSGGTPGRVNSVYGLFVDTSGPKALAVNVLNPNTIEIDFDEEVDSSSATSVSNYSIGNGIGQPDSILLSVLDKSKIVLVLPSSIIQGELYTLNIQGVKDCPGNTYSAQSLQFIIPFEMEYNDVVINEVLFNPKSGGVDFVELVNKSDKIFDISVLQVIELDPFSEIEVDRANLIGNSKLLFPGDYIALTSDPAILKGQYYIPYFENLLKISDLPNYPDEEGIVVIQTDSTNIIDKFHYNADWHFALIDDENGVSLERISIDAKTQDQNNWFSAASLVGFATPGYENSQKSEPGVLTGTFSIEEEVFSPDGDGFQDYLSINYSYPIPGNVANIWIFNIEGRKVRQLVNNELLGTKGTFLWDGLFEDGSRVPIGIYVLLCEVFSLDGQVNRIKLKCVVAAKY